MSVATAIFIQVGHREFRDGFAIAGQDYLERFDIFQFRLGRHDRRNAVKTKHQLAVNRVLDPQRAVLVEGSDSLLRRDEIWRTHCGRFRDEIHDGLFGRAVVP